MENEKFIELKEGEITAILTKGYRKYYVMENLIKDYQNERVMIWQNGDSFYPCSRFELDLSTNLNVLYDDYKNHFDVLIINCFVEWCNSVENINFVNKLKQLIKNTNKKVAIIFIPNITDSNIVELDSFSVYKDLITSCTNSIYLFNRSGEFGRYQIQDKNGNIISVYENTIHGIKIVKRE